MNNTLNNIKHNINQALAYYHAVKRQMLDAGIDDAELGIEYLDKALQLLPICDRCGTDLYGKVMYQSQHKKLCLDCRKATYVSGVINRVIDCMEV